MKIERVTLQDRLEVSKRQRDTALANYYREMDQLKAHVMVNNRRIVEEVGCTL